MNAICRHIMRSLPNTGYMVVIFWYELGLVDLIFCMDEAQIWAARMVPHFTTNVNRASTHMIEYMCAPIFSHEPNTI